MTATRMTMILKTATLRLPHTPERPSQPPQQQGLAHPRPVLRQAAIDKSCRKKLETRTLNSNAFLRIVQTAINALTREQN